jgi:hypothetical protein
MASITIRNLDEDTKRRLRIRAAEHGRSMEEEARGSSPRRPWPAYFARRRAIATICLVHKAAIVTRHMAGFGGLTVEVFNPWAD